MSIINNKIQKRKKIILKTETSENDRVCGFTAQAATTNVCQSHSPKITKT